MEEMCKVEEFIEENNIPPSITLDIKLYLINYHKL